MPELLCIQVKRFKDSAHNYVNDTSIYQMMYECPCCDTFFATKAMFKSHERKCVHMDIEKQICKGSKGSNRKKLPAAVRHTLWNTTFGERAGFGPCYCCSREVTQQTFEAGHILAKAAGGSDELSNLRVICRSCNGSMGAVHMDTFMQLYKQKTYRV